MAYLLCSTMRRFGRCAATSGRSAGRMRTSAAGNVPTDEVAGATVGGLLREAAGVVDAAEDVLRFAQEDAPGVGQRHVVTAAIEQQRRRPPTRVGESAG